MGKVSIGLRGWRFEEAEVFDDDGEFKDLRAMPDETRFRLQRLEVLVTAPCHGCWLIHGDENLPECNVAEVVYGEPQSEVILCSDHEPDFLYWFREEDGEGYMGEDELRDAFHEWFAAGGRAPEGYGGVDHVDTDPENLPEPSEPDPEAVSMEPPEDGKRIDLRDIDLDQDYPSS